MWPFKIKIETTPPLSFYTVRQGDHYAIRGDLADHHWYEIDRRRDAYIKKAHKRMKKGVYFWDALSPEEHCFELSWIGWSHYRCPIHYDTPKPKSWV